MLEFFGLLSCHFAATILLLHLLKEGNNFYTSFRARSTGNPHRCLDPGII